MTTKTVDVDSLVANHVEQVDAKNQLAVDNAIKRLKADVAKNRKLYEDVNTAFEDYKVASGFISEMESRYSEPEKIIPSARSGKSESTMVAIGTDWHVYETVKPEQVSGLNEYNPVIAQQSVENFFKSIVAWAGIHRGGTKLDTLVVAFLGDLISGMLHEDQMEGNFGSPLEETLFATQLVVSGLDYLLDNGGFKRVVVLSCDGNHSRITDKTRKANRVKHSLEWLMFNFIKQRYVDAGTKGIEFHIADGIHNYLTLDYAGGKTIRFCHGDEGILYQGGIGGMSVTANRTIDKWNVGRRADLDIFGHHHTSEHPRRYIAVGSVLGYSPYSLAGKYEFELPAQALVLFEKDRWETSYHKVYVR